jgi:uroporphyrinogen-III synthase
LGTGEGTARALPGREFWMPTQPSAEGLWALLQERFPRGGDFLLVRGARSRGHLETVASGTAWRLHPWITHAECPLEPLPELPALEAVLALSPLQAELLAPLAARLLRFAWGERSAQAFAAAGHPAHGTCEPRGEALERMLRAH